MKAELKFFLPHVYSSLHAILGAGILFFLILNFLRIYNAPLAQKTIFVYIAGFARAPYGGIKRSPLYEKWKTFYFCGCCALRLSFSLRRQSGSRFRSSHPKTG
jgi:hypothetical protein